MPTPPVLDVEALLVPISPEEPAGKSLAYGPEYDALREARRSEDDTLQGDWQRDAKTANWDLVVELGQKLLRDRTKDLQIAAWITESLGRLYGFAGLRDGLRLLHGIQDQFWDSYHPQVDDGDVESRVGPFLFLNDPRYVPLLVKEIPLTAAMSSPNYHYLKYRESRDTDNELRKNPDRHDELVAEGKITSEMFNTAVAQTPKDFYAQAVDDLKGCIEALKTFEKGTDDHFQDDSPSLLNLSKSLEECRSLLESILAEKRKLEPDPIISALSRKNGGDADAEGSPGAARAARGSAGRSTRPSGTVADPGQVLISFLEGAQELSEIGNRLKENRQRHAELVAQLKELDVEYEELSLTVSRNQEFFELLTRVNSLRSRSGQVLPAPESEEAEEEPQEEEIQEPEPQEDEPEEEEPQEEESE